MANIEKLLVPERTQSKLRKETYHKYQLEEKIYDGIIDRGLVTAISYYNNEKLGIPPYSVKIKTHKDFNTFDNDRYYPPLLPIHNISLPQVGEEVWMLFVTAGTKNMGFWISRVNYTSNFSINSFKYINTNALYKGNLQNISNEDIFGVGVIKSKLKELVDIEPEVNYKIPTLRVKPGDTVTHGRSSTHVFHTFDTKNKKGVVDIITEIEKSKKKFYEQEFHISKGARFLAVTKSNLDDIIIKDDLNKKFHADFGDSKEDSYAFIQANQIRLVSENGKDINHLVLAEQYADWKRKLFDDIISELKDMKNSLIELKSNFTILSTSLISHIHLTPIGPTGPVNPPNNQQISTAISSINNNFDNLGSDLASVEDKLNSNFDKLKQDTFSNNVAIN